MKKNFLSSKNFRKIYEIQRKILKKFCGLFWNSRRTMKEFRVNFEGIYGKFRKSARKTGKNLWKNF